MTYPITDTLLTIQDVIERYAPEIHQNMQEDYSCLCPFHSEIKPSFRVYPAFNFAKCYGECQKVWYPTAFTSEILGISRAQAERILAFDFDLDVKVLVEAQRLDRLESGSVAWGSLVDLSAGSVSEAEEYLATRGIRGVAGGYKIRVLNGRIVFPHLSGTYHYADTLRDLKTKRYSSKIGFMGDYPFGMQHVCKGIVYLTESAIDALSFVTLGLQAVSVRITALPDYVGVLSDLDFIKTAFDGDKAGRQATASAKKLLLNMVGSCNFPDGEDANSLLTAGTLENYL